MQGAADSKDALLLHMITALWLIDDPFKHVDHVFEAKQPRI
jgi:hypothetical protein